MNILNTDNSIARRGIAGFHCHHRTNVRWETDEDRYTKYRQNKWVQEEEVKIESVKTQEKFTSKREVKRIGDVEIN